MSRIKGWSMTLLPLNRLWIPISSAHGSLSDTYHISSQLSENASKPLFAGTEKTGYLSNSDERIPVAVNVLGTVLAPLFPILSIEAMYFVDRLSARLDVSARFTALFSAVPSWYDKSKASGNFRSHHSVNIALHDREGCSMTSSSGLLLWW